MTFNYPSRIIPDNSARPPEVLAEIRALEAERALIKRGDDDWKARRRVINQKLYKLVKVGIPDDGQWRNKNGRPALLPTDSQTITMRIGGDQLAFCAGMGKNGNVSAGIRACIDFTMASRKLPDLPTGLED